MTFAGPECNRVARPSRQGGRVASATRSRAMRVHISFEIHASPLVLSGLQVDVVKLFVQLKSTRGLTPPARLFVRTLRWLKLGLQRSSPDFLEWLCGGIHDTASAANFRYVLR